MKKIIICVVVVFCMSSRTQSGEMLPSDTDLKAAYCLSVKNATATPLGEFQEFLDKNPFGYSEEKKKEMLVKWNKSEQDRQRLKFYVSSRWIDMAEDSSLIFAMASGKRDAQEQSDYSQSLANGTNQCTKSCKDKECIQKCIDSPPQSVIKIRSCNDISWLPY